MQDFAIENAKGDAIKSKGVKNISFIKVRTEWTNGPDSKNGAYGLYPVESIGFLIDGCVAIGASDAGVYVGQSEQIIVRNTIMRFFSSLKILENHSAYLMIRITNPF